jgi:hypothetical protein
LSPGIVIALVIGALVIGLGVAAVLWVRSSTRESRVVEAPRAGRSESPSRPATSTDAAGLKRENADLQARLSGLQGEVADARKRLADAEAELEDVRRPFRVLESACNSRCPDGLFGTCLRAECNIQNPRRSLGAVRVVARMERFGKEPMEKHRDVAIGSGSSAIVAIDFPEVEAADQNVRCACRIDEGK